MDSVPADALELTGRRETRLPRPRSQGRCTGTGLGMLSRCRIPSASAS